MSNTNTRAISEEDVLSVWLEFGLGISVVLAVWLVALVNELSHFLTNNLDTCQLRQMGWGLIQTKACGHIRKQRHRRKVESTFLPPSKHSWY